MLHQPVRVRGRRVRCRFSEILNICSLVFRNFRGWLERKHGNSETSEMLLGDVDTSKKMLQQAVRVRSSFSEILSNCSLVFRNFRAFPSFRSSWRSFWCPDRLMENSKLSTRRHVLDPNLKFFYFYSHRFAFILLYRVFFFYSGTTSTRSPAFIFHSISLIDTSMSSHYYAQLNYTSLLGVE